MRRMKKVWARRVVSVVSQTVGSRGFRRVLMVRVREEWSVGNISVTMTSPW